MNKKLIIGFFAFLLLTAGGIFAYRNRPRPDLNTKFVQNVGREESSTDQESEETKKEAENKDNTKEETQENAKTLEKNPDQTEEVNLNEPGSSELIKNSKQVYQTFNNCGPATLSMILSWHGTNVSQEELGEKMRPYQNPQGDNDDKTIFTYEFVKWAEEYGYEGIERVNGDINILKKFIANNIPVVVKTWLHSGEDIGHFRLVRGYDDQKKIVIYDDSYDGPNKKMQYYDFLSLWQPFNYNYIIIYTSETEAKVNAILGSETDKRVSWKNALERAKKEKSKDPDNPYPAFNISTASYHLGNYEESIEAFEKVENKLPKRMLWYQIEPIKSYKQVGEYDEVFRITDKILNNGNKSFSELYLIRGNIYLEEGQEEKAKQNFELALKYNKYFEEAKQALEELNKQ